MDREKKQTIVNEFVEIFSESGFYLMDFKGLNVREMTELRRKLRESKVSMRVVKNTLAKRALDKTSIDNLGSFLIGSTGIVWSEESPITPARVLMEFVKEYKKGTIKAGMVDGVLIKDSDIERLSKIPDKQELYRKVASSLNAPISNLARVLNSVPQKFVCTINALCEEKKSEDG